MADHLDRNFGFVLFDDPKAYPRGGWASIGGRKPARISDLQELRNDVVWLTNIAYSEFNLHDLRKIPWLRPESYIPINNVNILSEWGVDSTKIGEDFFVSTISKCFNRIMRIAYDLIRRIDPRLPMSAAFCNATLAGDIAGVLLPGTYTYDEAASVLQKDHSHQHISLIPMSFDMRKFNAVRLRRPRVAFTTEILQTPVPAGDFTHHDRRSLTRLFGDNVLESLCESVKPVLVEVVLVNTSGEPGKLFSFGNTISALRTVRSWAPHPEINVLKDVAKLEIRSAYIGEGYKVPMTEMPEAVTDFLSDTNIEYSWSAGIVAEAIRKAYAYREDTKLRRNLGGHRRSDVSWEGLWCKSAERVATFLDALTLNDAGHAIESYSSGVVRCKPTDEAVADLIHDGFATGLLPDLKNIPDGLSHKSASVWGGDKMTKNTAVMHATKDVDLLWAMDEMPLLSAHDRQAVLKKISLSRKAKTGARAG